MLILFTKMMKHGINKVLSFNLVETLQKLCLIMCSIIILLFICFLLLRDPKLH